MDIDSVQEVSVVVVRGDAMDVDDVLAGVYPVSSGGLGECRGADEIRRKTALQRAGESLGTAARSTARERHGLVQATVITP